MLVEASVLRHAGKMGLKHKQQVGQGCPTGPESVRFTLKDGFPWGHLERRQDGGEVLLESFGEMSAGKLH